ncbi:MAG: hypothetical protein SAJ72_22095 [Jaaginema sp. PMC 1080.18]|nr:hypothetical protein [Jaaginema sp. PMC 1080.18]
MVSKKLLSHNFYLEFIVNENDWCSIFLGYNNKIKFLGADTLEIVIRKILSILDTNSFPEPSYTLHGKLYYLFIALFEKHTVGYARVISPGIEIHFRDVLNQPIVTVFLSHQERQIWKNTLENMIE